MTGRTAALLTRNLYFTENKLYNKPYKTEIQTEANPIAAPDIIGVSSAACTLTLRDGELTGLLGASGCGKTTLFKGICRRIETAGTCLIDGMPNTAFQTLYGDVQVVHLQDRPFLIHHPTV